MPVTCEGMVCKPCENLVPLEKCKARGNSSLVERTAVACPAKQRPEGNYFDFGWGGGFGMGDDENNPTPLGRDFDEEERAFLTQHMPTLPHAIARDFFDVAKWMTEKIGHFLTLEGEENGRLIYLLEGSVAITLKGQIIGRCEAGNFVGEMTALDGGPATASAMLVAETRYFSIGSADLKRLCMANPDLRLSLERAMMLDTRKKLMASNEALRQS